MGEQAERLSRGEWHLDDEELRGQRRRAHRLVEEFNRISAEDDADRLRVLEKLLGAIGEGTDVIPYFQCCFGFNTCLGKHVIVNSSAFFMDDAPITIGDHVLIGPGSRLMTAVHPVEDHRRRREGWERAAPITIGDNTWLGASVTVGAGVTIGRNSVVGAGSVVLRDIPDHVLAVGTPARVLRSLPQESLGD